MGRRLSGRITEPTEIKLGNLIDVSLCDLRVKLNDGRIGNIISSNGKFFRILINNKIEEIPLTEDYKSWIVLT